AYHPTYGSELWRYDGSGNPAVVDVNPGDSSSWPSELTAVGNTLYFVADHPTYGRELWRYDGNEAPVVADIWAGSASSYPFELTAYDGSLYFVARDLLDFYQTLRLWRLDAGG